MKMWFMNVVILLFFCCDSSACLSTGNSTVQFVSKNFYNVLHWDPAKPDFPGQRLLYTVEYKSDEKNQSYQIKEDCQNITSLFCDLTAETPVVQDVFYYAKVTVNDRSHGSTTRFKPLEHTILGRPILFTSTTELSLFVNVTLPLGPKEVSIADVIINNRIVPSPTRIIYTLNLQYPDQAVQSFENWTGQFYINLQKWGNYCGTVIYTPSSYWGRPSSEMASFCVTLSDLSESPWMVLRWILMSVAVLVALVIVSFVCACKYVKGGKPKSMTQELIITLGNSKILQEPDKNLIISPVEICPQRDEIFYAKIQMNTNGPSVRSGGYSPQDIPCRDTSTQSSDNYGAVAVQVPPEDNEDFQQAVTEHRETSHPPVSPLLPDHDSCDSNPAGKLLIHTIRDISGKLVLPLFNFQLQSSNGDTVSPAYTERKLLLSDLTDSKDESSLASLASLDSSEWSDSGCDDSTPTPLYCNTHSFPAQPAVPDSDKGCQITPSNDATFESTYKQNWTPELFCGPSTIDSCIRTNYMWTCTGSKMEPHEEVEDSEGTEQSKLILLGSWTLQIQE
ncbi:interferon lambda receptor 1 [Archocentrus centrarchus]|uniref:interferon lambda receptor 1 n=1 Tax=Archocentrus centrarchus TaxID=63155 RepID=UPI0011E9E2B4|nr:uncharacterized protein LOC115794931 [Archocentrus centrarchus]